ncbi:ArsR family transcriptional regulator [Streptosporangium sp. DT93]|uniref:ArsR/SmtB family transcription factor n=1 Tax=Streptosporangium sp. DT93 TaxID=3393428 RepID=UPI003CFB09EA
MGWWEVNADTLAGSRFVVSPLAETTTCLIALERARAAHPGERRWLDDHLAGYRARLAADPVTALLVRAALGRSWIADFLTLAPSGEGSPGFEEELERVRRTQPETARADLEMTLQGPVPAALHRSDLPERAARLLEWVWEETVLPYWPRRRRVLEADILARTDRLTQGGWAAVLGGMRPGTRWLGGNRLQINTQDRPPQELAGVRLMFVPVTRGHGWVAWSAGTPVPRYALVYPCSGALAEPDLTAPEALGRLLGPARAGVLVLLGTPMSTSQLVALTGQGLGSVGRHLRILLDAGLVRRRRAGRSVLYQRTSAGETLVRASAPAG